MLNFCHYVHNVVMDVITFVNISKPLVVYRFYCMALFHSQAQRHNDKMPSKTSLLSGSTLYCSHTQSTLVKLYSTYIEVNKGVRIKFWSDSLKSCACTIKDF